jgi:hypothetical protein
MGNIFIKDTAFILSSVATDNGSIFYKYFFIGKDSHFSNAWQVQDVRGMLQIRHIPDKDSVFYLPENFSYIYICFDSYL